MPCLARVYPLTTVRLSVSRDECADSLAWHEAAGPIPGGRRGRCYFLGRPCILLCVHLCYTWTLVPKALCTPLGSCVHKLGSQYVCKAAVPSR